MRIARTARFITEPLESRTLLTTVTVTPIIVQESDTSAVFVATLDVPATEDVTLSYKTANQTARAGTDYTTTKSTFVIAAGETAATFSVPLLDDAVYEPDEAFAVSLKASAGIRVASKKVLATVTDDETSPTVSIADVTITEGGKGKPTPVVAQVALSNASSQQIRVVYHTADGTANATDYKAAHGTVSFRPGALRGDIKLRVTGDTVAEADEMFVVALDSASNATLTANTFSTITITDDDGSAPVPFISITGVSKLEGNTGTSTADFIVELAGGASADTVTVAYNTANGTATSGTDYTALTSTLTFAPGETSKTISIPIIGDSSVETDETFSVILSSPTNATIATGSAIGTIVNDDTSGGGDDGGGGTVTPTLSIGGASTSEGNSGTKILSLPVTLSDASTSAVTVSYATANTTATAGTDYTSASSVLTFAPGETTKSVSVTVNGDTIVENDETFSVTLTSPSGATLSSTSSAIGTILNDDTSTPSTGTTLSSNLSATSGGTETASGTTYLTASFTTGSSASTLSAVTLQLAQTTAGSATVELYSDAGLEPGSSLGTLTSPGSYSSSLAQTVFNSTGIALAANRTYWVVLKVASGSFDWSYTNDNTGTGVGFTGEWGSSTDGGATWFTNDAFPLQMSVTVA